MPRKQVSKSTLGPIKSRKANTAERKKRSKLKVNDISAAAREHADIALDFLRDAVANKNAPWSVRLAAANSLLDRGFGKAASRTDVSVHGTVSVQAQHLVAIRDAAEARLVTVENAEEREHVARTLKPEGTDGDARLRDLKDARRRIDRFGHGTSGRMGGKVPAGAYQGTNKARARGALVALDA